jgi:hypothetical protein
VTSARWGKVEELGGGFTCSSTLDTGLFSLYDLRVAHKVATQFLQRGLFDHEYIGANGLVGSGLGGVIHLFDLRRLETAVQSIMDPFLLTVNKLFVGPGGASDLVAAGPNGFTLWRFEPSTSLHFRGLHELPGAVKGLFTDAGCLVTTDGSGSLREWGVKSLHQRLSPRRPARGSAAQCSPVPLLKPSPRNPTCSGDWDWDFEFQEDEVAPAPPPDPPAPPPLRAAAARLPSDDIASALPLRELDDLIGFYLS